jgi:malonyl-CoA/methylmalonyl-CoA synthetase
MTETCMNSSSPLNGERRPGSVGPALPGVTIRITDEKDRPVPAGEIGEIQVSGPNVFAGYWGMPDKTAQEFTADQFFRTGDLGAISDDGYLSIRGRKKDMIISGGLNVYPREVEQVLDGLQGVAESAVVGVPHPDFGEAVIAVIVPKANQATTEERLIASVRAKLADFKTPKRVFFAEQLPRNTMGKIRKNDLREQYNGVMS